MKNNKLICVILALLVCLTLVVSASATETDSNELTFTLETTASVEQLGAAVVNSGETFTVNVSIASNPGIVWAQVRINYDAEKLELVKSVSLNEEVVSVDGTTLTYGGDWLTAYQGNTETTEVTGYVAALTFKVIETTDVKDAISVKASSKNVLSKNENDAVVYGTVEVVTEDLALNIVGKDHSCDAYDKVEMDNAVLPSCVTEGKKTDVMCSQCAAVTEGDVIAATGEHVYDKENGEVTLEATCTTEGSVNYYCGCGAYITEAIEALGHIDEDYDHVCDRCEVQFNDHDYMEWVTTKEATCSEYGTRIRTCKYCAEVDTDDTVPKLAHTDGEWKVTTEATEEAEGVETQYCAVCGGAMDTRSIDKLPESPDYTVLIVVIVVVVVLAGAGVAAYIVLKRKKK